ncbi:hypothetical protein K474DRAFT_1677785 [Panus rudis PR-1116 ss-1]|nr:hypothetical protein K474DRAFT_1677785 [Panus rudis PR-1116 ss-1]
MSKHAAARSFSHAMGSLVISTTHQRTRATAVEGRDSQRWSILPGCLNTFSKMRTNMTELCIACISQHNAEYGRAIRLLAGIYLLRHDHFAVNGDVKIALALSRDAHQWIGPDHPDAISYKLFMFSCMRAWFYQKGVHVGVEGIISLAESLLAQCPPGHPDSDYFAALENAAEVRLCIHDCIGGPENLHYAMGVYHGMLDLQPDNRPERLRALDSLASIYLLLFNILDDRQSIDTAAVFREERLRCTSYSYPERCDALDALCTVYFVRFKKYRDAADIRRCVALSGQSLEHTPTRYFKRIRRLRQKMQLLNMQYKVTSDPSLVSQIISLGGTLRDMILEVPASTTHVPIRLHKREPIVSRYIAQDSSESLPEKGDDVGGVEDCEAELRHFPDGHADRVYALERVASSLFSLSQTSDSDKLVDMAIELLKEAVNVSGSKDSQRPGRLVQLSNMLQRRHRHTEGSSQDDMRSIISHCEEVLDGRSTDLDLRSIAFLHLVVAMHSVSKGDPTTPTIRWSRVVHIGHKISTATMGQIRARCSGDAQYLSRSMILLKEALVANPGIPQGDWLWYLLLFHAMTTLELREQFDVEISEDVGGISLLPQVLCDLARHHITAHSQTKEQNEIQVAVDLIQKASAIASSVGQRQWCALVLGEILQQQYNYTSDSSADVLDRCIQSWIKALSLCFQEEHDRSRAEFVEGILLALNDQFKQVENVDDLHRTILSECMHGLSDALDCRFALRGDIGDLNDAIELQKAAIAVHTPLHPSSLRHLRKLVVMLQRRYAHLTLPSDLEKMILYCRQTLSIRGDEEHERITDLGRYAIALDFRHSYTQEPEDLDLLREIRGQVLNASHEADDPAGLSSIKYRMLELHSSEYLSTLMSATEKVIQKGNSTTNSASSSPFAVQAKYDLQISLCQLRYDDTGDLHHLDEGENICMKMLEEFRDGNPQGAKALRDLSALYGKRVLKTRNPTDLDRAISYLKSALAHPGLLEFAQADVKVKLATMLIDRNLTTEDGDRSQVSIGRNHLRDVATNDTYALRTRLEAAASWATISVQCGWDDSALEAYRTSLTLLSQLAWYGTDPRSSLNAIKAARHLTGYASIFAVVRSHPRDAIEFLESGRSILWTQASLLRAPVDDLAVVNPILAHRIRELAQTMESGRHRENTGRRRGGEDPSAPWKVRQDWFDALREVRNLPGFENFLDRQSYHSLAMAARDGPVVILIPHKEHSITESSIAVIIESPETEPVSLTLPISADKLELLQGYMCSFAHTRNTPVVDSSPTKEGDRAGRKKITRRESSFVLRDLWDEVAEPIVEYLIRNHDAHKPNLEDRGRLWWCCVGQFAFLPVHAAGIYNTKSRAAKEDICVSDYFISSYTPSLETLLRLRDRPVISISPKVLAAIQPNPGAGNSPLPHTKAELQVIYEVVPATSIISMNDSDLPDLEGECSTTRNIMDKITEATILHLACHGTQDVTNPLQSAFILRDGERLTVEHLMRHPLPNAYMAFLSACQTAANDLEQPDEAISLSSAMLFAGFRSVLATMWPMGDPDGPEVARIVYSHLFDAPGKTMTEFCLASSLDAAIRQIRNDNEVPWERWATFIHVGV